MGRNLAQQLKRLEGALSPATPNILTITAIASASGEIISESHLVMYDSIHRGRRTNRWAAAHEEIEPRPDRR